MSSFKGAHFLQDIILIGGRWYVVYPLSYRHVEERMEGQMDVESGRGLTMVEQFYSLAA